jgi:hypothetical protein
MKHFYLNNRHAGKKPLPSRTDNAIREVLIHSGNIRPAHGSKDRPSTQAMAKQLTVLIKGVNHV